MPAQRPLIIAHRGSSARAPENTRAAFRAAIADGADGVEFDVRLARDGVPVVIHDPDLSRTAGRAERVSEMTSSELAGIDVGSWFNSAFPTHERPSFAEETIPSLRATLDLLDGFDGRIYIELKCTGEEAVELSRAVCDRIGASPMLGQIIVKSFTLDVVPAIRRRCPNVRTAALFEPTLRTIAQKDKHIVAPAVECGAHELSLHYSLATRRLMKLAERAMLPVTVWTIDDPRWMKRAKALGIKALITNDPRNFIDSKNE